jgi:hypothetical protein
MRVIDPGHKYALAHLDGTGEEILTFVKREGLKYPGNVGSHEGTNIQETLRVLIDRVMHLDAQETDVANYYVLDDLRSALRKLEIRAAHRHGRSNPQFTFDPENMSTCPKCGHVECEGVCRL